MSKFYAIRGDGFGYQSLDLTLLDIARFAPVDLDPDLVMDFSRQNNRLSDWWRAPQTSFVVNEGVEDKGIPDISTWIGASLVLSPRAYRYLGDTLKVLGELLPVTVGGNTFHIFNCLTLGEEDPESCEYEMLGDVPFQLLRLGFKESAGSLTVFKSNYEACLSVFCNQRFKDTLEELKLTGVALEEQLVSPY